MFTLKVVKSCTEHCSNHRYYIPKVYIIYVPMDRHLPIVVVNKLIVVFKLKIAIDATIPDSDIHYI